MSRARSKRSRRALAMALGAAVAVAGLAASAWAADDEDAALRELTTPASEVELGALYSSEDSFKFGEYTGLATRGFSFLGNVDLRRKSPWDSKDDAWSFRLRGLNLGLDSRYIDARWSEQGKYSVYGFYDQIPHYQTESARTFFLGAGGSYLMLPPGWVAGTAANAPPLSNEINAWSRPFEVQLQRRRLGGGLDVVLPENFAADAQFSREWRDGTKLTGTVIGNSGGNPRSSIVPQPVDYVTDQGKGDLSYLGKDLQLNLQYYGSRFEDMNSAFVWQNPFAAIAGWSPAAGGDAVPPGQGAKGDAPDNQFHQLLGSGGYSLPLKTRLTVAGAVGWMTQNDNFLPYTINPGLAVTTPLPRNSLDAEIATTRVDARVASRPLPGLRLNLHYSYDDRDNQTPRNLYVYVGGDSQNQQVGFFGAHARFNRPYSFTKHEAGAEAGYRLFDRTELLAGYQWSQIRRDLQETTRAREQTYYARLNTQPCSMFSGNFRYAHSDRAVDGYDGTVPLLVGENMTLPDLVAFDPLADFENHPLLRKYYLTGRKRDEVHAVFNFMPVEMLTLSGFFGYFQDYYPGTQIGLKNYNRLVPGVDLTLVPAEWLTAYAFYTFESTRVRQNGWSFTGTAQATQGFDGGRTWRAKDRDTAHTVGTGLKVKLIPDRLSMDVDYLFSQSNDGTSLDLGSTLAAAMTNLPFPVNKTRLHDASVHLDLQLTENVSMRLGYLFEHFDSSDWALDGVTPTTLSNVIASGRKSPNYEAHVVAWSFAYRFW
jgi:MtrB/PioB family decaheme-associated outer membrane protein